MIAAGVLAHTIYHKASVVHDENEIHHVEVSQTHETSSIMLIGSLKSATQMWGMISCIINCKMVRVVDGDTVDVDIDLGFGVWMRNQRIRMYGIDTPESRTSDLIEKNMGKQQLHF